MNRCRPHHYGDLRWVLFFDSLPRSMGWLFIVAAALVFASCSSGTSPEPGAERQPTTANAPSEAPSPTGVGQDTESFGTSLSQEGADSPEGAVKLLLEGLSENDQDKILDAFDPDYRNDPMGPANIGIMIQGLFSLLTGADIGQPEISFRDMSFRTEYEEDANFATVYVTGRVRALGREETLSDEPTPTVKKFERWFVTTEESPYFAGKAEREEQEEAAREAAAEEARRQSDIQKIAQTISVSLGEPWFEPDSMPPEWGRYHADVTVRNADTLAHDVLLSLDAFAYTCPEGYGGEYTTTPTYLFGDEIPPGEERVFDASSDGFYGWVACRSDVWDSSINGYPKARPLGARFSICIWDVDDYTGISVSGLPACETP